jgi:hypothetical protein
MKAAIATNFVVRSAEAARAMEEGTNPIGLSQPVV